MLALAKHGEEARVPTQKIQEEMLVPHAFLQRIIADLSRRKLIRTFPGPNGGLQLAHPISSVTLLDIYEAIEGPLLISPCLGGPEECPLDEGCPVRPRWGRIQALVVQELAAATLSQLAQEAEQIKIRRDTL
jgi:Rrf2 family protein